MIHLCMNKYNFLKMFGMLAVVLITALAFTACGATDNTAEIDKLKQERDTAITERDTAVTERNAAQTERDTAITQKDTAITERNTAQTERDTAIAQRDTAQTERDAAITQKDTAIIDRDTALAGKSDALNQAAFYGTVVDALSAQFQMQINNIIYEDDPPSNEIRELLNLVTDVLQAAKDGEVNTDNVEALREEFAAQFVSKFTALYDNIYNGEDGYTGSDGYSISSYPGVNSNSYYIGYNGDYAMQYVTKDGAEGEEEFDYAYVQGYMGSARVVMAGDLLMQSGNDIGGYTNGIVNYSYGNYIDIYVKGGELIAVMAESSEYETYTFADGVYKYGVGYSAGGVSLEILISSDGNIITAVAINGGEPIELNITLEEFEDICEQLEIVIYEVFGEEDGEDLIGIYIAEGFDGIVASVNEKIAVMEQIIAKILELAA